MKIEEIKKIELGKNDVILVKHPKAVFSNEIKSSRDVLKELFPNNNSLFYCNEWDINIIKQDDWIMIGEGPAQFQLIPSGWKDGKMYHLLYENPEEGDYAHEHHFVSEVDIVNRFPYAVERMKELQND